MEELREYYEPEMINDSKVEWVLRDKYGRDWEVVEGDVYRWEKDEGRKRSCRERKFAQVANDQ